MHVSFKIFHPVGNGVAIRNIPRNSVTEWNKNCKRTKLYRVFWKKPAKICFGSELGEGACKNQRELFNHN